MKLIIDIPEEDVNGIGNLSSEQLSVLPIEVAETLMRIKNGIPLDKIRAEINGIEINGQIDEHTSFIRTGGQVKRMALEIISKFTKGE